MSLPTIQSPTLAAAGVRHAFFTRAGGASDGVYASLNGGVGSSDDRANVLENRRRMADALGVEADRLLVPFQIHSPVCLQRRCSHGPTAPAATRSPPRRRNWRSASPAPIAA